mgnify:CR=1 FL=1
MTGMKRIEILRPWAIFVWLFVWQAGVLVLDQQYPAGFPCSCSASSGRTGCRVGFLESRCVLYAADYSRVFIRYNGRHNAGWGFCQTAHIGRIAGTLYASSEINSGGFVYYPCPDIIFFP